MVYDDVLAQKRKAALNLRLHGAKQPVELIIGTTNFGKNELARRLEKIGNIKTYSFIPYVAVECEAADARRMANHLYGREQYREFNTITSVEVSGTFSIPTPKQKTKRISLDDELWNLQAVGAYEACVWYTSSKNANVAVIDTGANYEHPEIKRCFGTKKGYNFIGNNNDPLDDNGHGTHVAGIISGYNCGVTHDASLVALKVLGSDGQGSEADVISALEWCVKNNMDIANLSLGAPLASSALEEMCSYAYNEGILIVAAAGNDGKRTVHYPAGFGETVIGVAATGHENEHAYFSNISSTNDVSSPGIDILSCYLDYYAVLDGTSMATPHITGALAVAVSYAKKTADLEDVLERTTEKLGGDIPDRDAVFGAGLLRADRLMNELMRSQRIMKAVKNKQGISNQDLMQLIKNVVW